MIAAAETLEMSRAMVTRYRRRWSNGPGRVYCTALPVFSSTDAGERTLERCRQMLALAGRSTVEEGQSDELRACCASPVRSRSGKRRWWGRRSVSEASPAGGGRSADEQPGGEPVEERIDLALRITNELDPNLIARPLSTCASVVCAAPAYLAAHGTPRQPQDLALHNRLTYSYFGKSLWHFDVQGVKSAVAVSGNLSANESVVLMAGTVQGRHFHAALLFGGAAAGQRRTGRTVAGLPAAVDGHLRHLYLTPPDARHLAHHAGLFAEWFATDPQWQATLR